MLQLIGCHVEEPTETITFNGIHGLYLWPRVTWTPHFASTFDDLLDKFVDPSKVFIGLDCTLRIDAPQARISSLHLKKGALIVKGPIDRSNNPVIEVNNVVVDNMGWEWRPLEDVGAGYRSIGEEESIRGFTVMLHDEMVIFT